MLSRLPRRRVCNEEVDTIQFKRIRHGLIMTRNQVKEFTGLMTLIGPHLKMDWIFKRSFECFAKDVRHLLDDIRHVVARESPAAITGCRQDVAADKLIE